VAVITKRNGDGAIVSGVNLEANVALSKKIVLQSGATIQTARFSVPELIWGPESESDPTPAAVTNRLLRTPNRYGFFSLVYSPTRALSISYSGVITGSMDVAHVIDPDTEQTVIKATPTFVDKNIKITYTFTSRDNYRIQLFAGMQNIFNSFQRDFDIGAQRDAGYIYGPLRPRTVFMGLKVGLN